MNILPAVRSIKFKSPDKYKPGDILVPNSKIKQRIKEVALEIAKEYKGKKLVVVGILKGGYKTTSLLIEELHRAGVCDLSICFITLRSYRFGTNPEETPRIVNDMDLDPKGRHVLIVDDILDTGKSLKLLKDIIKDRNPASLSSFVLIDKPDRRKVECTSTFTGFTVPNLWLQGFGMDTNELGRADPNIIVGPFDY